MIDKYKDNPILTRKYVENVRGKFFWCYFLKDQLNISPTSQSPSQKVVEHKSTKYVSPKKESLKPFYLEIEYENLKNALEMMHCPNYCSQFDTLEVKHTTFQEKNTKFHLVCSNCDQFVISLSQYLRSHLQLSQQAC